jgi:uncharacterized protein YdaU (DUF1376 family)
MSARLNIHFVRLHIGDLVRATNGLSPNALAAYMRLYFDALNRQKPIPASRCSSVAGMTGAAWKRARTELLQDRLIELADDEVRLPLAEATIAEIRTTSERKRAAANARWRVVEGDRIEDSP